MLDRPGGAWAEAMKIGRLVRALKLQTIVPERNGSRSELGMSGEHGVIKSR
jgi:hypothetical protein